MSVFDLLFIVLFLATAATLLRTAYLAIRGHGARALVLLRRLGICVGSYLGIVALTSALLPRTILQVGDPRCFDDWCIAVASAERQPAVGGAPYVVALRLFSTARRVSQRENGLIVYLVDEHGRRYEPASHPEDVPFNVRLSPQESVTATRSFAVPTDARGLGLVISHSSFPIAWLIIGYESWFRKPAIVRLPNV